MELATRNGFVPSQYQQAIFDFIQNERGHLVVEAVAGSGKSTTLVQAAQLLPQNCKALFAAFNNHISTELGTKLKEAGSTMECRTVHSLGKSILDRQVRTQKVEGRKYSNLCRDYLMTRNIVSMQVVNQMSKLIDAVRLTLTQPTELNLINLVNHYGMDDVEIGEYGWYEMVEGIPQVLEAGTKMYQAGIIDFADMLYLPIALNLPCPKYDILMLDECQDFNAAQLALIMKCCASTGRMIFVGDRKQAIQGFAFADTNSVNNIIEQTKAAIKPLSICYRCASSVVYMAHQLVNSIEAAPGAIEGTVETIDAGKFVTLVQPGDMVICRTTAPLVEKCLMLLRAGIKAVVRVKDIGKSFVDLLGKLRKRRGFALETLGDLVEDYRREQLNILVNVPDSEMKAASLEDKVDTFIALYEAYLNKSAGLGTIIGFEEYIQSFFSDDEGNGIKPVMFSTVHKAKGLEANRVFILRPDLFPHPAAKKAWQYEQELNIEYVAITRAKKELYFVGGLPKNLAFAQPELPEMEEEEIIEAVVSAMPQNDVVEAVEAPQSEETIDSTSLPTKRPYGGRKALGIEDKRVPFSQLWDSSIRAALKDFTVAQNTENGTNLTETDVLEQIVMSNPAFAAFFQASDHKQAYDERQVRAQERQTYKTRKRAKKQPEEAIEDDSHNPDDDPNGGGIPAASSEPEVPANDEAKAVEEKPTFTQWPTNIANKVEQQATNALPLLPEPEAPVSIGIQRIAYTCLRPSCHKSWLTDYHVAANSTLYRYQDGHIVYAEMDFPQCPYCRNKRQFIKVRRPKLTHNSSRKCDNRCRNAKPGSNCDCACGGVNHGMGQNSANMIGQTLLLPEEKQ